MTPYEQHLIACKGWSDAAGSRPINTAYEYSDDYHFGYKLGIHHRQQAFKAMADKLGVEVQVVRALDTGT